MSFFDKNLAMLRQASEVLADKLQAHHDEHGDLTQVGSVFVEPSRSGPPTLRYSDGERDFFLHSPYDPLREAQQWAESAIEKSADGNFTVIFGLGLGYGALEILRRIPADERVLIYEPNWELFYLAMCHTDLTEIMTRSKTTVSCDHNIQNAMFTYMNLFELAAFRGVRMISNPAFDKLPESQLFDRLADKIRYEMTAVGGNVQTLMVMGEMQQMNIMLNFPQVLDNPPFRHLIERFRGRPVVIVSAGPSLEKNMHLLNEMKNRAVIIAVDTAVKILMAQGITPHIVVTGDPQEANARHLRNVDLPEAYLIAEPQSPISSVRDWTGPRFMCSFHDNIMRWVDRVVGDRGRVLVWGSVAVMAYDIAVKLGGDPIVFIGQDLSFPGGRTYASGTYFETEQKQEMTVAKLQREGTLLIEMTDIYGQPVQTNRQMYSYYNFLLNRFKSSEVHGRTLINATEGGILQSDEIRPMPLAEVMEKYMQEEFDPLAMLAEAHALGNDIEYPNLLNELDALIAQFRLAVENCRKGITAVERTLKALENEDGSIAAKREIVEQYNRLVALRKEIFLHQEMSKMVEMSNQAGIYAFAQGVRSTPLPETGVDNDYIRSACYHYHTLYQTTRQAAGNLLPLFEAARSAARERMLAGSGRELELVAN
ncbi:MAG: 6-hydroxymethylpterin diphosphokinase MptE-like protein [bacterium]